MNETPDLITPSDAQAEKTLLGISLLDANFAGTVADKCSPADFFDKRHQWIFSAIGGAVVADEPVTCATIARRLKARAPQSRMSMLQEIGGEEALFGLISGVDQSEGSYWLTRVQTVRKSRELFRLAEKARLAAVTGVDPDTATAEFELALGSVSRGAVGAKRIDAGMDALRERISRYISAPDSVTGLATGYWQLDQAWDGIQRGTVTAVYGPTSRGKSQFVQNIGWRFAHMGVPGLWYSTEMPSLQVDERLLQLETGLNLKWLRQGRGGDIVDFQHDISEGIDRLGGLPIFKNDKYDLDIGSVVAEISRQKKWNAIEYVVLDLLDGVSTSRFGDGVTEKTQYITSQIKGCALKNDVAVIFTTHMNKPGQGGETAIAGANRMTGSASKSQDVDNAISINAAYWDVESKSYISLDEFGIQARIDYNGILPIVGGITKARMGERPAVPFEMNWNQGGRINDI